MKLLQQLCGIQAPSGNERKMTEFVLNHIDKESKNWKVKPKVHHGKGFQDCIVLVFGKPRTAIFAHMDSIGFTVRYGKELVKIGGPRTEPDYILQGEDSKGKVECKLKVTNDGELSYDFKRELDRGTSLTFKPLWKETKNFIQCCYMDNRLGVWNALKVAETLENGIICFSTYEEHAGGSVGFLTRFVYEHYKVDQALISDITWVTDGVKAGKGVAVSLRDSGIPRRAYTDRIQEIAMNSGVPHQFEVESSGGSDGNQIQKSPYPVDWCFVGAPEQNVHSPKERVHKDDIQAMVELYKVLMREL